MIRQWNVRIVQGAQVTDGLVHRWDVLEPDPAAYPLSWQHAPSLSATEKPASAFLYRDRRII